jgi:hypothetical protein
VSPERTVMSYNKLPLKHNATNEAADNGDRDGVYQILQETALVNVIQSLVEYGNSKLFESFKLRVEMEDAA